MLKLKSATPTAIAAAMVVAAVGVDVLLSACGEPGGALLGPETPQRLVVTISAGGVSPATVKPPICQSSYCVVYVQFINRDSVPHDIRSDPHPEHSICRILNTGIGTVAPGETKEVSMQGCGRPERFVGYHDELRPDDQRFWGRIEEQ
jgi:hypothetical protein